MRRLLVFLALLALAGCGDDGGATVDAGFAPREACADPDPLRRAYFGDLHVHTAASLDANLQGTRLTALDAYRFARGEEVGIQPYDERGEPTRRVRLARPLDFVAVTDHAEFLGTIRACEDPTSVAYEREECVEYRENPDSAFIYLNAATGFAPSDAAAPELCGIEGVDCDAPSRSLWAELQRAAQASEDRTSACTFSAFAGYEWTGNPATENLHRNVIFRDETVPEAVTSYFDASTVEGLWAALREDCREGLPGCDVLTIPHNSNLSNERMFDERMASGAPFDEAYVRERAAFEPLLEIFQHKGASECRPDSAEGDPACDFELLPYINLAQPVLGQEATPTAPNYARHALSRGLALESALGSNPFHYGFVASTDTHIAAPGLVDEDERFPGHGGAGSSNRDVVAGLPDVIEFNPGGLAVLWAEENSRESLFDAMARREAYGTSGPRITLRFFGADNFDGSLCAADAAAFAAAGYEQGVPMGGSLSGLRGAPTFAVSALRDPGTSERPGGLLQRVQIVRGWVDEEGVPQAEVFDVAGGENGASVDPTSCVVSGPGHDRLCAVWTDPAPRPNAYYYARVLENPSCRWSTPLCRDVDCADPGERADCCKDSWSPTVQERAWSSPIWVQP